MTTGPINPDNPMRSTSPRVGVNESIPDLIIKDLEDSLEDSKQLAGVPLNYETTNPINSDVVYGHVLPHADDYKEGVLVALQKAQSIENNQEISQDQTLTFEASSYEIDEPEDFSFGNFGNAVDRLKSADEDSAMDFSVNDFFQASKFDDAEQLAKNDLIHSPDSLANESFNEIDPQNSLVGPTDVFVDDLKDDDLNIVEGNSNQVLVRKKNESLINDQSDSLEDPLNFSVIDIERATTADSTINATEVKQNISLLEPPLSSAKEGFTKAVEDFEVNFSNLKNREEDLYNMFSEFVFGNLDDTQVLLEDGDTRLENTINVLIRKASLQMNNYESLGFENKDQVIQFYEHLRDRLVQIGIDRQRECRERHLILDQISEIAMINVQKDLRDVQILIDRRDIYSDGIKITLEGKSVYEGVQINELKLIARNYIYDLTAGRLYNYKKILLAPTREDVESGRRTSMELVDFDYVEERRSLFFENKKTFIHQEEQVESAVLEDQVGMHLNLSNYLSLENKEKQQERINELREQRKLKEVKVQLSELKRAEERRKFMTRIREEFDEQYASTLFTLSPSIPHSRNL